MEEVIIAKDVGKKINWTSDFLWDFLRNVNFTIYKGEFITIVGQSGSGKSTLLGMLMGYDKDYEGNILINGVNIQKIEQAELEKFRNKNIGFCCVDKEPIIFTDTVKENVYNRFQWVKDKNVDVEGEEILKTFNLVNIKDKKAVLCTPMELYRLMLAVTFCNLPPIIIIDEILDFFELEERKELLEIVQKLQRKYEITMIIATHDIEIIRQSDRALYIKEQTMYKVDMNKFRALTDRSNK